MVKITGTHRVSVDRVQIIGEIIPPTVVMQLSSSSISEAALGGTAVVVELDEPQVAELVVPFTVSGTATRGIDYELRSGPGSADPIIPEGADFYTVGIGHTTAPVYVTPTTADDDIEVTETVVITLDESDDESYTVGTPAEHTVYIEDATPAADPYVSVQNSGGLVSEGNVGATTTVRVPVQLSRFADGTETTTFAVSGTAGGGDYTMVTTSPLTWSEGQGTQDIEFTVHGNDTIDGNRTVIITLTGGTDVQLGTLLASTTTIVDDDSLVLVPEIAWYESAVTVNEGAGQVSFPIDVVTGASPAGGIAITVLVSSATASDGTDYELGLQTLHIPQGSTTVPMLVSFPLNTLAHADTELVLSISVADDSGAQVSGSGLITITINNTTNAEQPIDGVLVAYDDTPLAPARVQFDAQAPDILFYTDGVQVLGNNGVAADWYVPGTNEIYNGQPVFDLMLLHADIQWAANNPLVTDRAAVKMGSEHNPVLVQCFSHARGTPSTVEQLGANATGKQFTLNTTDENSWSTVQTDCRLYPKNGGPNTPAPCVRDLILFGVDLADPVLFAGISFGHDTGLVDNFRMENLRCRPKSFVKAPFFVSREVSYGTPQGRIKLYDCSGRNFAHDSTGVLGWGTSQHRRASKWGLRAEGRACWDIRVQAGAPYQFADSNEEHYIYADDPVGDVTYPELKVTAVAQGQAEAGNYFIGIKGYETEPPGRTAIQIASRATSNPGDRGSGDLTFINCAGRNIGSEIVSGGQGFSVWGHGGRVYFKDCEYTLSAPYTQSLGGIGLLSEQSWANGDDHPHGAHVVEGDEGTGYIYQVANVVVDGFTYRVASQGNGSRSAMKFFGVEHLKLVKFDLQNDSGSHQINMNSNGFPGLGFTADVDIDDLVYPDSHAQAGEAYTGAFSAYPGWDGKPKIHDGYFMNWYGDTSTSGDGGVDLGTGSIDDYASVIVPQQLANRLTTASMAGTKWVTVDGHPATPNPQDFPNPRMISGTTYLADYQGETHTVRIDMKYAFMCEMRLYHSETGTWTGAGGTFDYAADSLSPIILTPPQLVGDSWDAANEGDNEPLSYHDMEVTITAIVAGGPTASETMVFELGDGGPDADYEFPKGSGTRVNVSGVSPLTHTVQVVPAGGMWDIDFPTSSVAAPYPDAGDYVAVTVSREDVSGNADGDKFTATFNIAGVFSGRCSDGLFYDLDDSGSTDVYTPATSFTIAPGVTSKTFYVGGLTTVASEFVGVVQITLSLPSNSYAQLGATPLTILSMNNF